MDSDTEDEEEDDDDIDIDLFITSFPFITINTLISLYISWFQSNYSNIRIFCIIRIFEYWFLKNEYYSLFVFVQFWFPKIIHYSYSSYFHYSLQHWPEDKSKSYTYIKWLYNNTLVLSVLLFTQIAINNKIPFPTGKI